ncbi:hypothetical protein [Georgenia sunbinii]|uniref:hypothetical protein n=1 Tax=Georgenia sunbinii TaxID=3117728 RepID=UPI002F269CBB
MLFTVILVCALAGLLAVWALAFAIADRAVVLRQLIGGGVVVAALVVQAVVAGVLQAGGTSVSDPLTLWGYLVVSILLLPIAAVWAFADRTRWSSVVLVVAAVAIIAMELRIWQVWSL